MFFNFKEKQIQDKAKAKHSLTNQYTEDCLFRVKYEEEEFCEKGSAAFSHYRCYTVFWFGVGCFVKAKILMRKFHQNLLFVEKV